ncbi:MAG: hypothetical protein OXC30_01465 [Alphaproteobacteria bacterium]|nr:hypothetical protein [Alphaproteobacteria bacterium]
MPKFKSIPYSHLLFVCMVLPSLVLAGSGAAGAGVASNVGFGKELFARKVDAENLDRRSENQDAESGLFGYGESDYRVSPDKLKKFNGKFQLKKIVFHGNSFISNVQLQNIAKAYVGREVGFQELNELKRAIYQFCSDSGLLFHRVLLPTQEVRDGDVDFYIRETNVGRIVLSADAPVRRNLAPYIAKLHKARTRAEYERILKLMQKLAGYKVVAIVKPMKDKPTYLEMQIVVQEDKVHLAMTAGNTLIKNEVGPYFMAGSLSFDNIIGLNEHFEIDGQAAYPHRELKALSTSLTLPLGHNGFSLTAGWSGSASEQSKFENKKKIDRPSGTVYRRGRCKLGLAHNLLLNAHKDITAELSYYRFGSIQEVYDPSIAIAKRKKPITESSLDYSWVRLKLRAKFVTGSVSHVLLLSGSWQPRRDKGDILYQYVDGKKEKLFESAVGMARSIYSLYTLYASLPKNVGLSLLLGGQYSLDPRQGIDFFRPVGDMRTTYAYPMGTLAGASGFSARTALSKVFPASSGFVFAPYTFFHYGAAFSDKKVNGSYNYTDLYSWGLGVDMSIARSVSVKLEYAHPCGHMRKPTLFDAIKADDQFIVTVSASC